MKLAITIEGSFWWCQLKLLWTLIGVALLKINRSWFLRWNFLFFKFWYKLMIPFFAHIIFSKKIFSLNKSLHTTRAIVSAKKQYLAQGRLCKKLLWILTVKLTFWHQNIQLVLYVCIYTLLIDIHISMLTQHQYKFTASHQAIFAAFCFVVSIFKIIFFRLHFKLVLFVFSL